MKTYILSFKASGQIYTMSFLSEVHSGLSTLSYRQIVIERLTQWFEEMQYDSISTCIVDIVLFNENHQLVYSQEDWRDFNTVKIISLNENTNSDLILY